MPNGGKRAPGGVGLFSRDPLLRVSRDTWLERGRVRW